MNPFQGEGVKHREFGQYNNKLAEYYDSINSQGAP